MELVYYSGTLMYTSMYSDKELDRSYGEGVMFESVKEFKTYSAHITDDVKNIDGRVHHAWIVPAVLNPQGFINDHRYVEDERTLLVVQDSNGRKTNVQYVQKLFLESSSDMKRRYIMYVRTLQSIEKEEDLFIHYCLS